MCSNVVVIFCFFSRIRRDQRLYYRRSSYNRFCCSMFCTSIAKLGIRVLCPAVASYKIYLLAIPSDGKTHSARVNYFLEGNLNLLYVALYKYSEDNSFKRILGRINSALTLVTIQAFRQSWGYPPEPCLPENQSPGDLNEEW